MTVKNLSIIIFPTFSDPFLSISHGFETERDPNGSGYIRKQPEKLIFKRYIFNEFSQNGIEFDERIVEERAVKRWRKVETSMQRIELNEEVIEFLRNQQSKFNETILRISSWETLSAGSEVLGYEKLKQFFDLFHGRIYALDIVAEKFIDLEFLFRHKTVLGCPQIQMEFSDEFNSYGSLIPSSQILTMKRENIDDILTWLWHPTLGIGDADGQPHSKSGINRKLILKLHCDSFIELIESIKKKFLQPETPKCEHGFEVISCMDVGDQQFELTNHSGDQILQLLIYENDENWPHIRQHILRLKSIGQEQLEWKSIDKKVHKMEITKKIQLANPNHTEWKTDEVPLEPKRLTDLFEAFPEASANLELNGPLKDDDGLMEFLQAISPLFEGATLKFDHMNVPEIENEWFEQILAIFAHSNRIDTRKFHSNHPAMDCQEFRKTEPIDSEEDAQQIAEWLCKPNGNRKAQISINEIPMLFNFIEALTQQFLQAQHPLGFECQLYLGPDELQDEALEWGGFYVKPDEGTFRMDNPQICEAMVFNEYYKPETFQKTANFVLKCIESKSTNEDESHEKSKSTKEFATKIKEKETRPMEIRWSFYSAFKNGPF